MHFTGAIFRPPSRLGRAINILLVFALFLPLINSYLVHPTVSADDELNLKLTWTAPTASPTQAVYSNERTRLVLTPPDNTIRSVTLMVDFSLPAGAEAAPDEISIHVPMYIFTARDGTNVVNTSLEASRGVHELLLTKDHVSGLYYEIDEDHDEYIIHNWKTISGGDQATM